MRMFKAGQRVSIQTSGQGHQMASLGLRDIVVHLNALPELTGTVLEGVKLSANQTDPLVPVRPDGWPLRAGISPGGFLTPLSTLRALADDAPTVPCVVTDQQRRPVQGERLAELMEREPL